MTTIDDLIQLAGEFSDGVLTIDAAADLIAALKVFATEQQELGRVKALQSIKTIVRPDHAKDPPIVIQRLDPVHSRVGNSPPRAILSPLEKPFLTYEEAKQMIDRLYKEGYLP